MKAKEVHQIMKQRLGMTMKLLGFQVASTSTAKWSLRIDDGDYLLVWVYISWSGFSPDFGSWLVIELAMSPTKLLRDAGVVHRYSQFLTQNQKDRLLGLGNAARQEIPALTAYTRFNSDELPYLNPGHVEAYADALRDILPEVISSYLRLSSR